LSTIPWGPSRDGALDGPSCANCRAPTPCPASGTGSATGETPSASTRTWPPRDIAKKVVYYPLTKDNRGIVLVYRNVGRLYFNTNRATTQAAADGVHVFEGFVS
jgi:hypothetical protein